MQYRPFHPSKIRQQKQLTIDRELRRLETEPAFALMRMNNAIQAFGISVGEAAVALLRLGGSEAIALPDDEVMLVEDAPPMEVWRDGLRFDERGICIGSIEDFIKSED
jgi:hypothetical protein